MTMREVRPGYWNGEIWHQGRRKKISFKGSAADAKLYEAQKRVEIRQTGIIDRKTSPSFASFCVEVYKPYAKAHLRRDTWNKVRRYQVEHLVLFFRDVRLLDVEPLIERYKMERRKHVAKVTVNSELTVFSAILTYADKLKVPCAKPTITYFPIRPKKGKVRFWSLDELQRLYETCMRMAPALFPLVFFLGQTGARKSEALHLPWDRVDFERRIIKIWSQVGDDDDDDDDNYEVKSIEREVPLSDALSEILTEHKQRGHSREWVFPSRNGTPFASFPKGPFNRILKAAGLTGGPHKIRHTYASNFLAAKPDLYLLGRLLGHTHERVTAIYAHLVPGYLAEARNVLPGIIPARNPTHSPTQGGRGCASDLAQVIDFARVGAIGFEPTTPTVSR